ncbi:hypothetical protein Tco_1020246 [Tanacetum coccineum]|uniref:Uncharacterized protein n=1 Tax=Tanacetum coccineum TaxID=301880 RepID=A0ABQ5FZH1_9ASTR
MAESSSQKTSSPDISPKEKLVTLDKLESPNPFLPASQVDFTFDEITFTTNNEVALLYSSHPNQYYFEAVLDFISVRNIVIMRIKGKNLLAQSIPDDHCDLLFIIMERCKGYNGMQSKLDIKIDNPTHSSSHLQAICIDVSTTSTSKKMLYAESPSFSSSTTYSAPSSSKARSHNSGNVLQDVLHSLVAESEPEQQAGRKMEFDKKEAARFNKKACLDALSACKKGTLQEKA